MRELRTSSTGWKNTDPHLPTRQRSFIYTSCNYLIMYVYYLRYICIINLDLWLDAQGIGYWVTHKWYEQKTVPRIKLWVFQKGTILLCIHYWLNKSAFLGVSTIDLYNRGQWFRPSHLMCAQHLLFKQVLCNVLSSTKMVDMLFIQIPT